MRPDKHKKKNHAAYARKAAEKSGGKSLKTSGGKEKKSGPKHDQETIRTERPGRHEDRATGGKGQQSSDFNEDVIEDRPSFSRRKIESNWQQYDEMPDEEETIEQRGADFTLLLSQTAGAQFRFKDEEALDDDDSSQTGISAILSFDCNQLAERLQSIPLPERLEISRKFFDQETLEILDQDAATSKPLNAGENSEPLLPTAKLKKPGETYFDQDLEDLLSGTSVLHTESPLQSDEPLSTLESKDVAAEIPVVDSHPAVPRVDTSKSHKEQNSQSEEDVLDFLLTLSSDGKAEETHSLDMSHQVEDLFSGNETIAPLKKEEQVSDEPHVPPRRSAPNEKTESLDDWLDSILDD